MDPAPFLRGIAFPGTSRVPYPRARPDDAARLPLDTWYQAQIPAGVRLEIAGDAAEIEIEYRTATDDLGPRGEGAGRTFSSWRGASKVDDVAAELGDATVRLALGDGEQERAIVYLPEGMRPAVLSIEGIGGDIEPAPAAPRWIAYGDSVAEGWNATEPALAWPAIAARDEMLDVVNMGYAGAARGEIVSAEHVAELEADVVSLSHGTNCWNRIPHSVGMVREGLRAFIDVVRQGHPQTPVVVVSPVIRPDAEATPNRLGASLSDIRDAMEDVVAERMEADPNIEILPGRDLVTPTQLDDGVHPNDEGHRALAAAIGPRLAAMVRTRAGSA